MIEAGWAIPLQVAWHGVRDSAWPIIAFAGLYEVTGEHCWMDAVIKLADIIVDTQHDDGSWDMQIGWYKATKVPLQTGIGMNGLCRAHAITGDERYLNSAVRLAKTRKGTFPKEISFILMLQVTGGITHLQLFWKVGVIYGNIREI